MSHARPASEADAKAETSGGGGGDSGPGSFSEQGFVEKLNKLNNTATKIQTLSNWCIFHRKRARKVVDIWEKRFNNATKDKKVSFLYLSNDILQNSKRKGGEFVNEFWRVLPGLLKDFYDNGEEDAKKVVGRLIGIWDDRKVFGTRIESLKEDILGGTTHTIGNNGSSSNPSSNPSSLPKAVRKDSSTTMKKLTVGGIPEMIVTAYQSLLDRHFDEDTALNKCKSAISVLEKMEKDVDDACIQGIQPPSSLVSDLQGREAILKQCIEQLESVDTARITLINKLREALTEQEAKSELLRNQLHIARTKTEHAMQLRQRLGGALNNGAGSSSSPLMVPTGQTVPMMHNSATRPMFPQFQPLHPSTSVPATSSAVRDEPKKTAAAMADKLASLSAPEQVLSSIFSSLAAEAASRNGSSPSGELSTGPPGFETNKKPRLENPIHASDMGPPPFFGPVPQVPPQIGGTHPPMQSNQAPGSFPPPPPPLPLMPPQFGQSTGGMFGLPFAMVSGSVPPPPPLPNIMSAGFPRLSGPPPPPLLSQSPNQSQPQQQQQQQQQQQSPQAPQQSPTSTGFFQTSGAAFFPPVQVQQSPVQRQ